MSTTPTLNPRIIGQAENAHKPVIDRILAETGTTFHEWVATSLAAVDNGVVDRDQLVGRMTGALKIDDPTARAAIAKAIASGLLEPLPGTGSRVGLTDAGRARYSQIRSAIDDVTVRVYGDLPPGDLATAGRVLALVTARLNAEMADDQ